MFSISISAYAVQLPYIGVCPIGGCFTSVLKEQQNMLYALLKLLLSLLIASTISFEVILSRRGEGSKWRKTQIKHARIRGPI